MINRIITDLININLGDIIYSMSIGTMLYLVGGKDEAITGLLLFMLLDFITGLMKGIKNKNLNSKMASFGIMKKIAILIIVIMGNRMDLIFHLVDKSINCRFIVICFYLGSEGLSILENITLMGVPVPVKLKKILEQCKDENKISLK